MAASLISFSREADPDRSVLHFINESTGEEVVDEPIIDRVRDFTEGDQAGRLVAVTYGDFISVRNEDGVSTGRPHIILQHGPPSLWELYDRFRQMIISRNVRRIGATAVIKELNGRKFRKNLV